MEVGVHDRPPADSTLSRLNWTKVRTSRCWYLSDLSFIEQGIYVTCGMVRGSVGETSHDAYFVYFGRGRCLSAQASGDTSASLHHAVKKAGYSRTEAEDAVFFEPGFGLLEIDWDKTFYNARRPRPRGRIIPISFDDSGRCYPGDFAMEDVYGTRHAPWNDTFIRYIHGRSGP